jgi:hypothetical protein
MQNQDATCNAELQAKAQYESIVELLAGIEFDYDEYESLQSDIECAIDALNDSIEAGDTTKIQIDNQALFSLLAELEDLGGKPEWDSQEEAREAAQDNALDVQVRSGWQSIGDKLTADEFMILLCTGGPAVRIRGELDRGTPSRAWLEYQDWGTPWTQYYGARQSVLVEYASIFYFGE